MYSWYKSRKYWKFNELKWTNKQIPNGLNKENELVLIPRMNICRQKMGTIKLVLVHTSSLSTFTLNRPHSMSFLFSPSKLQCKCMPIYDNKPAYCQFIFWDLKLTIPNGREAILSHLGMGLFYMVERKSIVRRGTWEKSKMCSVPSRNTNFFILSECTSIYPTKMLVRVFVTNVRQYHLLCANYYVPLYNVQIDPRVFSSLLSFRMRITCALYKIN